MWRWKRACDQPPWSWRRGAPRSGRRARLQPCRRWSRYSEPRSRSTAATSAPLAAADQRHERREMELGADPDPIRHRTGQRQRLPDVVESRREHRVAVGAVAVELLDSKNAPSRSRSARSPCALRRGRGRRGALRSPSAEQRADARGDVAGGRRARRIEVEVEADGAPASRPGSPRARAAVQGDRGGHAAILLRILADRTSNSPPVGRSTRSGTARARSRSWWPRSARPVSGRSWTSGASPARVRNPQFDHGRARGGARGAPGIAYRHAPELGGRRSGRAGRGALHLHPHGRVPLVRGADDAVRAWQARACPRAERARRRASSAPRRCRGAAIAT